MSKTTGTLGPRAPRASHAALVTILIGVTIVSAAHGQDLAIRGATLHTMVGPPIRDGVVLIRDGKIAAVGSAAQVAIPADVASLEAAVVTPGLIDAHSVVGLTGQFNQSHDQDQLERSEAMQPELRALDAYNPHERLVEWVRGFGVTTLHTGHAPGELISGQTLIVKTAGNTVDQAVLVSTAAVAATLGPGAQKAEGKSPGTRGKMMAMLRGELLKAQAYAEKRAVGARAPGGARAGDGPDAAARARDGGAGGDNDEDEAKRDLRLETLARVLSGELPLLVTCNRAQDIASALRLAREFRIRLWLDSAAEAYLLTDDIKAAGVPVLVHPTMARASGDMENMTFENAARLRAAGIPIALQSGYESYVPKTRVVLYEAGWAAANGLTFEQALAAITIDAARILGVDDRIGSLEVGKDGDVALYDGDPFEWTAHCVGVVIDGHIVSDTPR